jgi:hypothetical protein
MTKAPNQITGAKVAGACRFMRLVLSRLPSSRSSAYRHFAQFTSEVIRQEVFQDFFTGFLKGLLPNSMRSKRATRGLPCFFNAAS